MSTLRLNGVTITLNGVDVFLNGADVVIIIVTTTERTIYIPSENRTVMVDQVRVPGNTTLAPTEIRVATPTSVTENRTVYADSENRFVSVI